MSLFFKQAITNFKQTGALFSSSRFLVKKMLKTLKYLPETKSLTIVELGPGNGFITHHLLNKFPKNATIYVFEINPVFCEILSKIKDNRLVVINDSAQKIDKYINQEIDFVFSSLPLAQMNSDLKHDIIASISKRMHQESIFYQYQYSLLDFKLLRFFFPKIKISYTLLNLPPAFIYTCKK